MIPSRGVAAQIRLNATMSQSVVTYTVVVSANNLDLKLLPYLTRRPQVRDRLRGRTSSRWPTRPCGTSPPPP